MSSNCKEDWRFYVSRIARHEWQSFYDSQNGVELPQLVVEYREGIISKLKKKVVDCFSSVKTDPILFLQSQLSVESVYWISASIWNKEFKKISIDSEEFVEKRSFLKKWLDSYTPVRIPYQRSWLELLTGGNKIFGLIKNFAEQVGYRKPSSHLVEKDFALLSQDIPVPLIRTISAYVHLTGCDYCKARAEDYKILNWCLSPTAFSTGS